MKGMSVLMDDGKTDYFVRMDMVKFASEHAADLPFFGWCCGRRDGYANWREQVDMVKGARLGPTMVSPSPGTTATTVPAVSRWSRS